MKKAIPTISQDSNDPPKIPLEIPSGSLDVNFHIDLGIL